MCSFERKLRRIIKKLDGGLKQWVDVAKERLEKQGSEIGTSLRNNPCSKLAGFKELKNDKLGIRLIYKLSSEGNIKIIEIIAIRKKVFKMAENRRSTRE